MAYRDNPEPPEVKNVWLADFGSQGFFKWDQNEDAEYLIGFC